MLIYINVCPELIVVLIVDLPICAAAGCHGQCAVNKVAASVFKRVVISYLK